MNKRSVFKLYRSLALTCHRNRPSALVFAFCCLAAGMLGFSAAATACDFESLVFHAEFDGGRLDACEMIKANGEEGQVAKLQVKLLVKPENTPINPSPWYAFSARSKVGERTVAITIEADNARARYVPKISTDKKSWSAVDFTVEDNQLHFDITLSNTPIYVAGQELTVEQDYQNWMKQAPIADRFTLVQVGTSVQQRPIYGLEATQPDNKEWLLIIGRQHPPEITGALALFAFVERIAMNSELPEAFFQRFNVLVVPMINPDGVAEGNWRHNINGVDLNRDWGKFTQPETLSTFTYFNERLENDHRLVFALDFHSTQQDVFYTMPSDYGLAPADFSERWLADLKEQRLSSFTVREQPGSSPGRGVFKQFIAEQFGVHAVTYEMSDNTDRKLINHIAHKSADSLMELMLSIPVDDFKAKDKETSN